MPSRSLSAWTTTGSAALDQVNDAHAAVGGSGRGRRVALEQVNAAYLVLLCAHFQRFARDLHSEAIDVIVGATSPPTSAAVLRTLLAGGRKLDGGNANEGTLGNDFARFGLPFWDAVEAAADFRPPMRQAVRDANVWRNAIAHQDFSHRDFVAAGFGGRMTLRLEEVRAWRKRINALSAIIDDVIALHLASLTGTRPW